MGQAYCGKQQCCSSNDGAGLDMKAADDAYFKKMDQQDPDVYFFNFGASELKLLTGSMGSLSPDLQEARPSFFFRSGATYLGEWRGNVHHGNGTKTWPDGSSYSGQWIDNKASGHGSLLRRNGDLYVGEWKSNAAHGLGASYYKVNEIQVVYRGGWRNDRKDGFGIECWDDGSWYRGTFKQGLKYGYGAHYWADGSIYRGTWENDAMNGPGIFVGKDGRWCWGTWLNSMLHGKSLYQWADGRQHCGSYAFDKKDGFGVFAFPNGYICRGYWSNGVLEAEPEWQQSESFQPQAKQKTPDPPVMVTELGTLKITDGELLHTADEVLAKARAKSETEKAKHLSPQAKLAAIAKAKAKAATKARLSLNPAGQSDVNGLDEPQSSSKTPHDEVSKETEVNIEKDDKAKLAAIAKAKAKAATKARLPLNAEGLLVVSGLDEQPDSSKTPQDEVCAEAKATIEKDDKAKLAAIAKAKAKAATKARLSLNAEGLLVVTGLDEPQDVTKTPHDEVSAAAKANVEKDDKAKLAKVAKAKARGSISGAGAAQTTDKTGARLSLNAEQLLALKTKEAKSAEAERGA